MYLNPERVSAGCHSDFLGKSNSKKDRLDEEGRMNTCRSVGGA